MRNIFFTICENRYENKIIVICKKSYKNKKLSQKKLYNRSGSNVLSYTDSY